MSKADEIFKNMCESILYHGTTTEGQEVRPHWEDGTPAYTIKQFGVVNRYDLREEFPAITFRKTNIRAAMDEILWIYQKKSNNVNDLNSHIWDEWADENGSIGKAYGYQIKQKYIHHAKDKVDVHTLGELFQNEYIQKYLFKHRDNPDALNSIIVEAINMARYPDSKTLSVFLSADRMDQIDSVLYDLKHTPFSRRILTNMYNFEDLHEMNLYPCAYSCTFNVTDEGGDKLVLNMVLNQRSQDVLVANNWNVVQYAILLMMIAQVSNMTPGVLLHVIADAHIYDRHVDIVDELISRESYPAPIVTLDPDITDFYDFTTDSITIKNYNAGEQIKNIPVAI